MRAVKRREQLEQEIEAQRERELDRLEAMADQEASKQAQQPPPPPPFPTSQYGVYPNADPERMVRQQPY
jgi:hypothetical protein